MGGERETLWTDCRRWQAPLPLSLPVGAGVGPATRRRGLQQCARGSRDLQTLGRRWMGSELGGGGGGGTLGSTLRVCNSHCWGRGVEGGGGGGRKAQVRHHAVGDRHRRQQWRECTRDAPGAERVVSRRDAKKK